MKIKLSSVVLVFKLLVVLTLTVIGVYFLKLWNTKQQAFNKGIFEWSVATDNKINMLNTKLDTKFASLTPTLKPTVKAVLPVKK